jgi:O-antigen/teichoic acid export membrane protein
MPFVFGEPYTESVTVLQIMAWTSVFGFQNYILWYGALAAHQERPVLVIQIAGLIVNVALNAVAIPLYGPNGAAAALVISDLFVVAGQAILLHRRLFTFPFVELLAKPAGVAIIVVPPAILLATRSAIGGAVAGALAYAGALLVLRYITLDEWRPVIDVAGAPFSRLRRAR